MNESDPLASFSPPVATWFREVFGRPTPPQAAGWPAIQRGEHTLILAPTGSGKTLAAFLWGIDQVYRELRSEAAEQKSAATDGVRLLYISPLKALNNDIERNLRAPLEGIRSVAARMGEQWPQLRVAVRTGDTPGHVRAQMVKHPPHILITTPESLYLILTSARARDMLHAVHTVIVDEIHTLCSNKRGAHLSLTLERLAYLAGPAARAQRIGLSATQRPLEEVARFLGGQEWAEAEAGARELRPRPVAIVDTGYRKPLDLQVVTAVEDFGSMPGNTIWPAIIARLLGEVRRHRTTLVFTNNRRLAERTADRLNAQLAAEETEEIPPGSTEALAPGGVVRDRGIFALGAAGPIRAHHGSMSKESRRRMEEDLKAGRLPALVGTSSLELGIDIGTVDLVVQLQSPKSVAQGLQRVGRSGHLVGQTSTGRIYATFREDLIEAAAIARGMLEGAIEETYAPRNPLDVLAQQIVAMVAVEDWQVGGLYDLIRQAYPYQTLSRRAFDSVLGMLAGKYYEAALGPAPAAEAGVDAGPDGAARRQPPTQSLTALRARISWDQINNRLSALPGSRLLAVSNAGTIPDTGAYGIYLSDGQTRVGELDEEFVFETRPGDAFLFGSQVWRVLEIQDDRLVVAPAPGAVPRMPFWNGDSPWRPYELGLRIGRFRRDVAEKLAAAPTGEELASAGGAPSEEGIDAWLRRDYVLDANSARNLLAHVRGQIDAIGAMSSDRTIVAEFFHDAVGEPRLVLHSAFGGRVNGAWALALRSALRERGGTEPELMASDDGIIFRFPELSGPPPLDLITGLSPAEARERILRELPNSALFGAQFRMAAGRALLLPRAHGRRRTPFWLQRLKAKDLLAVVRRFGDFPLVVETYRACLQDVLDLAHLEDVLAAIESGAIQVVPVETAVPSPIASGLLFYFMNQYIYEWDVTKAERDIQALTLRREVLSDILTERADLSTLLRPEAITEVVAEMQHQAPGHRARSAEELAVYLQELGDRTEAEIDAMCERREGAETGDSSAGRQGGEGRLTPTADRWLSQLAAAGRVVQLSLPAARMSQSRWLPSEMADQYKTDLVRAQPGETGASRARTVLQRYLRASGPVTVAAVQDRYGFEQGWLDRELAALVAEHALARGRFTAAGSGEQAEEYCDLGLLERIQRRTLAQLRHEVQPVQLPAYAAFLARWQHLSPETQLNGPAGIRHIMGQLRGVALPAELWDTAVLPARVSDYSPADLAALCAGGELVWAGSGSDVKHLKLRFFFRGEGALFLSPGDTTVLTGEAQAVHDYLKSEGASFLTDLQTGAGLRREALVAALGELIAAGLVTNDSLAALWGVVASGKGTSNQGARSAETGTGPSERRALSSLESDLAERLAGKPRPLSHTRYNEARRRAARHVGVSGTYSQAGRPSTDAPGGLAADLSAGRWSLVHRPGVLGPPLDLDDRVASQAQVLLNRYGVLARDLLEHEDAPYDWALLYAHLQRLEMRGEVRRGYFVAGFAGAQFALPDAVEALRASGNATGDNLVIMNAADPANIYGGEKPDGAVTGLPEAIRFARVPSTDLVLWRGTPVLVAEDHAARLSTPGNVPAEVIAEALRTYFFRPLTPRHHVVARWNGAPVWGTAGEAFLKTLGFYRSPAGMEWWRA